jgi:hypothetical protein
MLAAWHLQGPETRDDTCRDSIHWCLVALLTDAPPEPLPVIT